MVQYGAMVMFLCQVRLAEQYSKNHLKTGCNFFWEFFPVFFLGFFSRFLGFDGFDWYLQRFAAKLSDLHGVVVVVVGWMDGWLVG